jgi:hypothetical protein
MFLRIPIRTAKKVNISLSNYQELNPTTTPIDRVRWKHIALDLELDIPNRSISGTVPNPAESGAQWRENTQARCGGLADQQRGDR